MNLNSETGKTSRSHSMATYAPWLASRDDLSDYESSLITITLLHRLFEIRDCRCQIGNDLLASSAWNLIDCILIAAKIAAGKYC